MAAGVLDSTNSVSGALSDLASGGLSASLSQGADDLRNEDIDSLVLEGATSDRTCGCTHTLGCG
jgi:hypothetical protein